MRPLGSLPRNLIKADSLAARVAGLLFSGHLGRTTDKQQCCASEFWATSNWLNDFNGTRLNKVRVTPLMPLLLCLNAYASDYSSPYGEWRGQTEYQAFIKTASDPDAHAVINLTINIEPGGKVVGTSTENGCRLLGLGAPGITATILTLNVTLSGCKYPGYNRTYRGYLSVFSKERYATLSLQAVDTSPGKGNTYNITSSMRR